MIRCLIFCITACAEVIVVSDRDQFQDPDNLSHMQMKRIIDFSQPFASRVVGEKEWGEMLKGKNVAVLIHGYNNEYNEAIDFFRSIMESAQDTYDVYVCYLWPGGDRGFEYHFARSRVMGDILPYRLLSLLQDIRSVTSELDIIAHSMGCRLSLQALRDSSLFHMRNLFLLAPAVDNEVLEHGEDYHESVHHCDDVYVFYSENDGVVRNFYFIGEGDFGLGAHGPEDPDNLHDHIHIIDCTDEVRSHSGYANSPFVFSEISGVVASS